MKTHLLHLVLTLATFISCGSFSAVAADMKDPCADLPEGVQVSVADMLSKVYGLIPADMTKAEIDSVAAGLGLVPVADDGGMWLDSEDGYRLSYAGVSPEVSARAEYDGDEVTGFTYYFLFPFECERTRREAVASQAQFCGSMLQEMHDMGMELGADSMTPDLMDVSGYFGDTHVDVNLSESDNSFVLILAVNP